ncbi:glycoside hydrolase family protein [Pontiella agarivorans]|uniref:Glycoside hydrolase family protein n=1 Tax=Pontiella agarivorans TaxID=3038953 RepID=A0ABU5MSB0_9BACT|nr:glycoside hydrolase family protein [Pontiella agarivorans]MDZ8117018.1 glycoside hydrolase family protein [Pontiella agarivorans]
MAIFCGQADGQVVDRERPAEWKNLVPGAQFKDHILPMPVRKGLTSNCWGGENVTPRDIDNGIEDPEWTYWGGDAHKDENGLYHLFVTRWPESHRDGHFGYFDSEIVHAVALDPMGPYRYQDTLGEGNNPELLIPPKMKNGKYVVYSVYGRYFISDSLNGPWKRRAYDFHKRERYVFNGYLNFSFAPRDDGSYLAVSRRGHIWASPDGVENWYNTSAESVYHKLEGIFEDPVLWKDDIQYHIIVNDWKGRIAYYLRSKDGFHWKPEAGEAYVPGISTYEDGTKSEWYKYERIRFLFDEQQRPSIVFFAVADCIKHDDLDNDNHSGKLIALPMRKARLLEMLNTSPVTATTQEIRVKVKAEEGFNPHTDLDLASLRYGSSDEVNFGRGSQLVRSEKSGEDLILVFNGKDCGFTAENFAGKLLGKDAAGELIFGWSSLPGPKEQVQYLSTLSPKFEFTNDGLVAYIEVQNFGELVSKPSSVRLLQGDEEIGLGSVRPLKPFETSIVQVKVKKRLKPGSQSKFTVTVESEGYPSESFTKAVRLPL